MIDREKVIKGLECCTRHEVGRQLNNCLDCPYVENIGFNQFRCKSQEMKEDALALLKEQEETEWEHLWDAPDGTYKGRCKKCGFIHYFIESHDAQYNFCPSCGRSVK